MFETLVASIIGFFVLSASIEFFFTSDSELSKLMDVWARVGMFERFRMNVEDLLNEGVAESQCGKSSRVSLSLVSNVVFSLHGCRRVDKQWRWVDTRYYLKSKGGVRYLYEKIGTKQAVAWLPNIKQIKAHSIENHKMLKGSHLFAVDLIEKAVKNRQEISPHFVFLWRDETA